MKSVWHLLLSQVHALRGWLFVWVLALTAWAVARWTYLTDFREAWAGRESIYYFGLMALSAGLVAALLHLQPPGRRVAAWRALPLRSWKVPAAQFLFVVIFLILLPGAVEALFLLHPKLNGFMADGMLKWLVRSLWPLPIALGLASASHSLRRFILDAILFTALTIGVWMLNRSFIGRTYWNGFSSTWGPMLLKWWIPAVLGGGVLLWLAACWKKVSPAMVRFCLLAAPLTWLGGVIVTSLTWPRTRSTAQRDAVAKGLASYASVLSTTPDRILADRIRVEIIPDSVRITDGPGSSKSLKSLTAEVKVSGLLPEEHADVYFDQGKLTADGVAGLQDWSPDFTSFAGTFGDTHWTPWTGSSAMAGDSLQKQGRIFTARKHALQRLNGKPAQLHCQASVVVDRSIGVARLPFRAGASWREGDREVSVAFIGSASEAAAAGLKYPSKAGPYLSCVVWRCYGHGKLKPSDSIVLIHKPSGFWLTQIISGAIDGTRSEATHSYSSVHFCGLNSSTDWACHGLMQRARTHPDEFEFIVRDAERVGHFSQEVTSNGIRLVGAGGGPVDLPVPDLARPEAVAGFFEDLARICEQDSGADIPALLKKCGPDILAPFMAFARTRPNSQLQVNLINNGGAIVAALFKPERLDHRRAFFESYGRPGLFVQLQRNNPVLRPLMEEGLAWVKEDPENRLTISWLFEMRETAPPALYPAIRRFLEKEGHSAPWRDWLHLPGLEPPAIVEQRPPVTVNGSVPVSEADFYRLPAIFPQHHIAGSAYETAVREGREWIPRFLMTALLGTQTPEQRNPLIKIWPEVSDCPAEPEAARAWLMENAERLHFNPDTRRYDIRQ